ncbi:hypothetical protein COOONC_04988 [Cooperia oncophora]
MYEIIFRALPFPDSTDIQELVESIKDGSRVIKPQIQSNKVLNMDLTSLILDCWNTSPEMRPSVRRIKLNIETYLKVWVLSLLSLMQSSIITMFIPILV